MRGGVIHVFTVPTTASLNQHEMWDKVPVKQCWPTVRGGFIFLLRCCWPTLKHGTNILITLSCFTYCEGRGHSCIHCSYHSTVELSWDVGQSSHQTMLTHSQVWMHVPIMVLLTYHQAWDRSTGCWVLGELHQPLLHAGPASVLVALSVVRSASWPTGPGTHQGSEGSRRSHSYTLYFSRELDVHQHTLFQRIICIWIHTSAKRSHVTQKNY